MERGEETPENFPFKARKKVAKFAASAATQRTNFGTSTQLRSVIFAGYGHIAPSTVVGKIVSMFYALVGMPLFLLYLGSIGDIMATSFKFVYTSCCRYRMRRQRMKRAEADLDADLEAMERPDAALFSLRLLPHHIHTEPLDSIHDSIPDIAGATVVDGTEIKIETEDGVDGSDAGSGDVPSIGVEDDSSGASDVDVEDEVITVPVTLSISLMISYIVGGAVLFGEWEGWGILDGSYFCFVTLSTIGFGDIVPGASVRGDGQGGVSDGEDAPLVNIQFIFCSMYILLGMAVISMSFHLMQESVVTAITNFGKKLGIIKDDDDIEEEEE